ncbi:MAG: hypothetical protein E6344_18750 [Clostridium sp.]|nr:hypothetical protein [Clostridium sp.]MDU7085737.1 hypothetical protein [Clostridium sp.]
MGKLTTKEIEEISIEKLRAMVRKTGKGKVDSFFESNDKGPSWDGYLILNNKEKSLKKEDMLCRIPVQIKGTEVDKLDRKFHSFPIDVSDLQNYLNDGGVFYIVVEITPEEESKIFYKALLPIDLQIILDSVKEGSKTKNVKIDNILSKNIDFYSECIGFRLHRENQGVAHVKKSKKLEDIDVSEITFLGIGDAINNPIEFMNKTLYPYMKDEFNCLIPIRDTITANEFWVGYQEDIIYNGKKYFDSYKNYYNDKGEHYCSFGDEIIINEDKITVKAAKGSLIDRLKTLEFVLDNAKTKDSAILEQLAVFERDKKLIVKIIACCDKYNINSREVIIPNLTDDDYYAVDIISKINMVDDNFPNNTEDCQLIKVKFINKELLLFRVITKADKQYYDFYNNNLEVVLVYTFKDEKLVASPYTKLKYHELLCDNFILEKAKASLERCRKNINTKIAGEYNFMLLEVIKAWDISNNPDYIELARFIVEMIENYMERELILINKAQVEVRLNGKLSPRTIRDLVNLEERCESKNYLAAIYILLEEYDKFEECFNDLTDEDRKLFREYPIYSLYVKQKMILGE